MLYFLFIKVSVCWGFPPFFFLEKRHQNKSICRKSSVFHHHRCGRSPVFVIVPLQAEELKRREEAQSPSCQEELGVNAAPRPHPHRPLALQMPFLELFFFLLTVFPGAAGLQTRYQTLGFQADMQPPLLQSAVVPGCWYQNRAPLPVCTQNMHSRFFNPETVKAAGLSVRGCSN